MDTLILAIVVALCVVALIVLAFRRGREGDGARIEARLASLERSIEGSVSKTISDTTQTLGAISERLQVIDQAQANISGLTGQILTLQQILSDKQSRGSFGEERLQAILDDQLGGMFDWQPTLSNGSRPDCQIHLTKDNPPLVVDSKFPFEAYERLRTATDEQARKAATAAFKSDVSKHVREIAKKYLLPGETQPIALMFVPSEAIFAELRGSAPDVLHSARRERVVIVSPHIFMLAVNMIQALVRDAKMREHADKIRTAVIAMMDDVRRLEDRVGKLRSHFDGMQKDVGEIETSLRKITSSASRIEAVEIPTEVDSDGGPPQLQP